MKVLIAKHEVEQLNMYGVELRYNEVIGCKHCECCGFEEV